MNTNPNTQLNINEEALQKAIKWALSHDKQLLAKQAKDEHLTAIYRYYSTNTPNPSNHQNNATMDNELTNKTCQNLTSQSQLMTHPKNCL